MTGFFEVFETEFQIFPVPRKLKISGYKAKKRYPVFDHGEPNRVPCVVPSLPTRVHQGQHIATRTTLDAPLLRQRANTCWIGGTVPWVYQHLDTVPIYHTAGSSTLVCGPWAVPLVRLPSSQMPSLHYPG